VANRDITRSLDLRVDPDPDPPPPRGVSMRAKETGLPVACATRITLLNISFISGPSNYRIPRTCGARRDVRAIALALVVARGRLQLQLREARPPVR